MGWAGKGPEKRGSHNVMRIGVCVCLLLGERWPQVKYCVNKTIDFQERKFTFLEEEEVKRRKCLAK